MHAVSLRSLRKTQMPSILVRLLVALGSSGSVRGSMSSVYNVLESGLVLLAMTVCLRPRGVGLRFVALYLDLAW